MSYSSPYSSSDPGPANPPTEPKAIWALVTSILGFIVCPVVLHIVGWVLANQSLSTISAMPGQYGGEGMAKAARILSIVGLVLSALGLLFFIFVFVILGTAGTTTG